MLSYQPTFFSETQELSSTTFAQLIVDDHTIAAITQVRQLKAQAAAEEDESARKALEGMAAKVKRGLPGIIWQATFDETTSAKGNKGRWRKQSAARLNGLFMLDIDHLDDPKAWWQQQLEPTRQMLLSDGNYHAEGDVRRMWAEANKVYVVHVTPGGYGIRIVGQADAAAGNLADNQALLAKRLGVEADEACKDASRLSFCPMFEDLLYINQEVFTYENKEYDKMYGEQYRQNSSRPTRPAADVRSSACTGGINGSLQAGIAGGSERAASAEVDGGNVDFLKEGYHGVGYNEIIDKWFERNGGRPNHGDRHRLLLRLASDLRYILDNNASLVERVIAQHPVGSEYVGDGDGKVDLARIASDVCAKQMWHSIPKRFAEILQSAGVQLADGGGEPAAAEDSAVPYDEYADRLLPLLAESPGLREAVADLPDRLKLGGVLAAGAMLGTYLTRCWWEHFDGKFYRLSFLTYIIGAAASGKSFLTRMDELLMAPMMAADKVGRAIERQFNEKSLTRKQSEKLPDMPHPVVRYCPSSTSNAVFYRRLQDAVDPDVTDPISGEPLHMHIITVESELGTALRSQIGSWAGKSDLELKSFHNEKAGVDYANAQSTNGIMQVNWNQVISGTMESFGRKIKPSTVLDGLVTRLALFLMPDNTYTMLERKRMVRNPERESYLRSLGYKLEEIKGELRCERLVDFCYDYEDKLTFQARIEQDETLDYFRKRIPVIMMRYALVRAVLRQTDALSKGEDFVIIDSDLEFAQLIGDWCLLMQMRLFGGMVEDARRNEASLFLPRKYKTQTRDAYRRLPAKFQASDLVKEGIAKSEGAARVLLSRWAADGLVEKKNKDWKKKITNI